MEPSICEGVRQMETRTKPETEREFSVRDALRKSLSANTRRAYRNGWRRFTVYCDEAGKKPMAASPADVADFLVRLASEPRSPRATTGKGAPLSMGTIRVALAAINRMYREHHRRSPTGDVKVADVFRGLGRRSYRDRRQVKALSVDEMARILACCDGQAARGRRGIIAVRDAAVMTVGFAAALRRSEICALAGRFSLGTPMPGRSGWCSCSRSRSKRCGLRSQFPRE
ncbi:MAG: hypothetical protein F4Z28_02755 [Gammaproteobacteria bacterium]|nr:hypothetical protein [Gammaproteobacteria bacterium]